MRPAAFLFRGVTLPPREEAPPQKGGCILGGRRRPRRGAASARGGTCCGGYSPLPSRLFFPRRGPRAPWNAPLRGRQRSIQMTARESERESTTIPSQEEKQIAAQSHACSAPENQEESALPRLRPPGKARGAAGAAFRFFKIRPHGSGQPWPAPGPGRPRPPMWRRALDRGRACTRVEARARWRQAGALHSPRRFSKFNGHPGPSAHGAREPEPRRAPAAAFRGVGTCPGRPGRAWRRRTCFLAHCLPRAHADDGGGPNAAEGVGAPSVGTETCIGPASSGPSSKDRWRAKSK